jgi:nucleoside-diphosphate-sugar epimerase
MQNILAGWRSILEDGIYRVPYAVETRLGMVDLEDVATAAAIVLTEPGHQGAIYELAGAETLTPTDVATILGHILGRPVRAETVPLDVWEEGARRAGLGDYQVKTLIEMFRYYQSYGFWGNPNVLGWLLGRPPTTFVAFVERTVREREASPEVRQ